jgi:hypothetical protein
LSKNGSDETVLFVEEHEHNPMANAAVQQVTVFLMTLMLRKPFEFILRVMASPSWEKRVLGFVVGC